MRYAMDTNKTSQNHVGNIWNLKKKRKKIKLTIYKMYPYH